MGVARPYQFIWFVGTVVFLFGLHSTHQASLRSEWAISGEKSTSATNELERLSGRPTLTEALRLAEKSWAKTVRQRHELMKEWPNFEQMPMFAANDSASYFKTPYSIWGFVPASFGCPFEMERIGRLGDGGKWVCGMSKYEALPQERPCVIYSFGVQFESSYEDETIERSHCEIWAYDFSVTDFGKQLRPEHKLRAHFTKAGIAGKTDPAHDPPFYSIQDLMRMNGHDYIDILKMDIEYSEFESMHSLSNAFMGEEFPIGQFLVEIHLFGYKAPEMNPQFFLKWWEMLESRGMRPAWTEPNLIYTTLKLEGGGDPRLAEYTFINVKDKRSVLLGEWYRKHSEEEDKLKTVSK